MPQSPLTVFLADPCFDHKGLNSVMPLGAGLVAAYAQQNVPGIRVKVFKALTPLLKAIEDEKPDVLGLTSYVWNKNLSIAVAEHARDVNPQMLMVFGGPEIDPNPKDLPIFVEKYGVVDIFVNHEGEAAFANLLRTYMEEGEDRQKLRSRIETLGNCFFITENGQLQHGPALARIEDLDDIPSPFTMGLFDHFLADVHYMPLLQTNRGCPFSCTFCQEGESYFSKVKRHSLEYVIADLDYISERVSAESGLWITDSNWAMYKWDEDIADHIASLQASKGWPTEIISSTGKAQLERILRITKKLNHTMYISNSVQSMSQDVLAEIKRKNLDPAELERHRDELKGVRQEPEVIVPLPNETRETFFSGLNKLLDSGPNQRFAVFQTMVLTNTEMDHGDTIEKFGLKIKHKQHSSLNGWVGDRFVCETERVVCATDLMPLDDFLECRVYAMLLDALVRFEPIREVFRLLDSENIAYSAFTTKLYNSIPNAIAPIRECIESFKTDLLDEMHDSEIDVINYMRENEELYTNGQKGGGNLRYSNMLWIEHFDQMLGWIFDTLRPLLSGSQEAVEQLQTVERFLRLVYFDRLNPDQADANEVLTGEFEYDVVSWASNKNGKPLRDFKKHTVYGLKKTSISNVSALAIWHDFGFKLDEEQPEKQAGYKNRLFIARLRRDVVECQGDGSTLLRQAMTDTPYVGKVMR